MAPSRQPLIAGNWKMHHGGGDGCALAHEIVDACGDLAGVDVVVGPPFTALAAVAHEVHGSRVSVAAQNLHPEPKGAFTGEISAAMLLESGCTLGHRRPQRAATRVRRKRRFHREEGAAPRWTRASAPSPAWARP